MKTLSLLAGAILITFLCAGSTTANIDRNAQSISYNGSQANYSFGLSDERILTADEQEVVPATCYHDCFEYENECHPETHHECEPDTIDHQCETHMDHQCHSEDHQECHPETHQVCTDTDHQVCQDVTHQQCSPETHPVCTTVDHQQCHEVSHQECSPESHQVCTTVDHQQCHDVSHQECTPETHQECSTEDHQQCHPESHQECSPVSHQVCSTHDECHDNGHEHSCTPVQECHDETSQECHDVSHDVCENVPEQHCHDVTSQNCHDVSQNVCENVPQQECHNETTQNCHDVSQNVCENVPQQECHNETTQNCHDVTDHECHNVPDHQCHDVTDNVCHNVPEQVCHDIPVQECHDVAVHHCHDETHDVCHLVPYTHEEPYACTQTITVPVTITVYDSASVALSFDPSSISPKEKSEQYVCRMDDGVVDLALTSTVDPDLLLIDSIQQTVSAQDEEHDKIQAQIYVRGVKLEDAEIALTQGVADASLSHSTLTFSLGPVYAPEILSLKLAIKRADGSALVPLQALTLTPAMLSNAQSGRTLFTIDLKTFGLKPTDVKPGKYSLLVNGTLAGGHSSGLLNPDALVHIPSLSGSAQVVVTK